MARSVQQKQYGLKMTPHAIDPFTGAQIRIGVMGSAGGEMEPGVTRSCERLGRAIANHGCCLLTGACPGLPHAAVLGAKSASGHVVGISPATTLREHVQTYGSPYREYDVLIFSGLGLMGRELINIFSSDIVVVVGGRSGTLGEFAIAYEHGKLIGVLSGSGGIAEALPALEPTLRKTTGSEVIYEANPKRLIDRLLARYRSPTYVCGCHPDVPIDPKRNDRVRRPRSVSGRSQVRRTVTNKQ